MTSPLKAEKINFAKNANSFPLALDDLEYGPAMLLRKPIKLEDIHTVLEIVFAD